MLGIGWHVRFVPEADLDEGAPELARLETSPARKEDDQRRGLNEWVPALTATVTIAMQRQ